MGAFDGHRGPVRGPLRLVRLPPLVELDEEHAHPVLARPKPEPPEGAPVPAAVPDLQLGIGGEGGWGLPSYREMLPKVLAFEVILRTAEVGLGSCSRTREDRPDNEDEGTHELTPGVSPRPNYKVTGTDRSVTCAHPSRCRGPCPVHRRVRRRSPTHAHIACGRTPTAGPPDRTSCRGVAAGSRSRSPRRW